MSLGDVVALVCHISLLCGKWTEFMCPTFKGGFRLLIVLEIPTPLRKSTPHGGPPRRLHLWLFPRKKSWALIFWNPFRTANMNFSTLRASAASGLVWEFGNHAQLTRCSTNPFTLNFCCHGNDSPGRCVHILIRKRNEISNLCGWGSSLLPVSSLSPCISQLRKVESFKMPFYYVGCGAHHVCWSSLCSLPCVVWLGLERESKMLCKEN